MQTLLMESAVRVSLIAAIVALVLWVMRVKAAAARHAVWAGVVVVMLLLPVWVGWGPRTTVRLLPAEVWQRGEVTRLAGETKVIEESEPGGVGGILTVADPPARWDGMPYILGLYLAGLGVLLARLGMGTVRVKRLVREAGLRDGILMHSACVTPVTVGWLRPRILLPEGWSTWPKRQLAAILAHEEAHVRRRDPLIQWLALFNRAVFWFHPMAWWLERELSRLAEEACDCAVLSQGHEPREYAQSLLDLARSVTISGGRLKVLGMAAPGCGLPRRVRRIFAGVQTSAISRMRLASIIFVCAAAAVPFVTGRLAHAQPAAPAFDVATIKPDKSAERGGGSRFAGSSHIGTNVTLKRVIRLAYEPIQEFAGGSGWMDSERYDITAKAEGSPSREQLQLMLRSLLADRFKLVVHKETRELPAYALVLARSDGKLGPGLRRSNAECSQAKEQKGPGGTCGFRVGDGALTGRGSTLERLASELVLTGRLVVDRTGLAGMFDVDLEWTPDELGTNAELFTALREQLGLKLEPTRAPVEVIVIDSAARPSEN